jgi:hypothetical protein
VTLLVSSPNLIGRSTSPVDLTRRGGEVNRSVFPLATARFSLPRSFVRMTHLYLPFLRSLLIGKML